MILMKALTSLNGITLGSILNVIYLYNMLMLYIPYTALEGHFLPRLNYISLGRSCSQSAYSVKKESSSCPRNACLALSIHDLVLLPTLIFAIKT